MPASIGPILDQLMPDASSALGGLPLSQLSMDVNGVPMTFQVVAGPLAARELEYAVSQSLLRDRVRAAVQAHRGYLVLSADDVTDVFRASALLSDVTATYAASDAGLAVWLPEMDLATTDVIYAGEASQRPALTWFNTMAAAVDQATSIAHTIGLAHLGGQEVQLRSGALGPADAYRELRSSVATVLESGTFPTPGSTLTVAGVPHMLTAGESEIGMGRVLDAVPPARAKAATPAPEQEAPRRKGWFGRR
ncbi:hypothetical protein C8046_12390 [Serinibacter arcticus]|uniref:Uncharacterized protein n=1 Tax=Serinibacter arcticus TaxID=1655435 RepID=A0A2U1ZWM3_9MICO|nr:hypothetical protein C8046_12390 [Serinibacter arcticus]